MRNFFYKKLFYYHYQLPDKPTKFFFKKVFKARTLLHRLLSEPKKVGHLSLARGVVKEGLTNIKLFLRIP